MRITEAAAALDMSPRMLRYREQLGLVPAGRTSDGWRRRRTPSGTSHRRYTDDDLATIELAVQLEERFDVSPAAVAFALRALGEPEVGAAVRELGQRLGRVPTPAARAVEIDRDRALRWLGRSGVLPPPGPPRR